MYGFHDRIAWVDLTRGKIEIRPVGAEDARRFVGGANLGAAILARMVDGSTDPLGPENPLIFMTGPLNATSAPTNSRFEVVALSPLTGNYGESNSGGAFARQLKLSGLDGIVFTGASDKPVALVIDDSEIGLRPCDDWWGKDVFEMEDAVNAEFDKGTVCTCIGPSGERKVLLAGIATGGRETRMAGRCGMGAVMGSKMLKALIVTSKGKAEHPLADAEGLKATMPEKVGKMRQDLSLFTKYGTPGSIGNFDRLGNLPISNWRGARTTPLVEKICGQTMYDTIMTRRAGCRRCPFQCARVVHVKDGPYETDANVEAPEYETLGSFGSMQDVDSLEGIAKANEWCNRLGLDSISTGCTIAFANECYEKGVLSAQDTDGLVLGFGQPDSNIELVKRMGYAETDIGKVLGKGSRKAAREIGRGAEEYAVESKGLEFPMHDPRFSWLHAISYATSNRGACHLSSLGHAFEIGITFPEVGEPEPRKPRVREGAAKFTAHLQNLMNMRDSLIVCNFILINNAAKATDWMNWYNYATGNDIEFEEFDMLGARGVQLKRMINNRRGVTRKDDTLPPRMQTLRKECEDFQFDVPPLAPLLSEFYDIRGWTEEGRPTAETVKKYGLEEFA